MTRELTVDVLVVGLGPAGACAAAAAARAGLRVLAIDRKSEAGIPVQCAEFVPAMIGQEIGALGLARCQSIRSMTTYVESADPHIKEQFPGHMIDRAAFDATLVREAIAAGADCRFSTILRDLDGNGTAQLSHRRPFSPPPDGEGCTAEPCGWGGATNETPEPGHPHPRPLPAGGRGEGALSTSAGPFSPPLDGEGGAAEPCGWGGATNETPELGHPHPQPLPARGRGEGVLPTSGGPSSPPLDGEGGAAEPRGWGGAANETHELGHPHPRPLPARGRGDEGYPIAESPLPPSNGRCTVRARVIIGADGPRSVVGRVLGHVNREIAETRQITVPLLQPFEATDIFLSAGIRGGYAWLFPKGDVANLGLGVEPAAREELKPLLESLHEHLVSDGRVGAQVLGHTGGAIPVGGMLEPAARCGETAILLAGDAAGLTNPVTGAGINAAVISGTLAGEAAARHCSGEARAATDYAEELADLFGPSLARALARRRELMQTYATGGPSRADLERSWIAFPAYWAA